MASRGDENRDLGFGSVVSQQSKQRLLNRDGSFNVVRDGLPWWASLSLYHALLRLSWPRFLGLLGLAYVAVNTLFAAVYLLCGPGALHGPTPVPLEGRFPQAFFFSVETFGTIGYGHVYPVGIPANVAMTAESFLGLSSLALATGIIFARFARPNVYTRSSYSFEEVIWGARFANVFNHDDPRQVISVDASRLHQIERVPLPA